MQWDIGNRGRVYNVRVVRSVRADVDDCIAESVENWIFPEDAAPKDEGSFVRILYPFVFTKD